MADRCNAGSGSLILYSRQPCCCCTNAFQLRPSILRMSIWQVCMRLPILRRCRYACSPRPTRRCPKCSSCPTAAITSWSPIPAAVTAAGRILTSRWREDTTCDNWGSCSVIIRDRGQQYFPGRRRISPTRKSAERFEAIFSEGRAEFRRPRQGWR